MSYARAKLQLPPLPAEPVAPADPASLIAAIPGLHLGRSAEGYPAAVVGEGADAVELGVFSSEAIARNFLRQFGGGACE